MWSSLYSFFNTLIKHEILCSVILLYFLQELIYKHIMYGQWIEIFLLFPLVQTNIKLTASVIEDKHASKGRVDKIHRQYHLCVCVWYKLENCHFQCVKQYKFYKIPLTQNSKDHRWYWMIIWEIRRSVSTKFTLQSSQNLNYYHLAFSYCVYNS